MLGVKGATAKYSKKTCTIEDEYIQLVSISRHKPLGHTVSRCLTFALPLTCFLFASKPCGEKQHPAKPSFCSRINFLNSSPSFFTPLFSPHFQPSLSILLQATNDETCLSLSDAPLIYTLSVSLFRFIPTFLLASAHRFPGRYQ